MKQSIRHNKIIELVNQLGYVSTEELVAQLNVSSQTIRRDLNELAENSLIRRHHGGAGALPVKIAITLNVNGSSLCKKSVSE